jgi:predicted RNA-binding protein with PUA-like domain
VKHYWLLKAEPETRLEGGVDVRFSIDDLAAKVGYSALARVMYNAY